jgi:DNA-directed RNA polymerase subunit RPC12/RpoP
LTGRLLHEEATFPPNHLDNLAMAMATRFLCSSCSLELVAWDDGNPYFLDERGEKIYAYHPDERRELCIGNDVPHLCLTCAAEVNVDSRFPSQACPQCAHRTLVKLMKLGGRKCPKCKSGIFVADPDFKVIS